MGQIDWEIRGLSVNMCNCAWGCPCQFNSLPTHGDCRAALAMSIEKGHFDDTSLDGVKWAMLFAWPGAVHQGDGEMVIVVDERADEAQRRALHAILNGEETEPGATIFNVFAATYSKVYDPLVMPIEIEGDISGRTGRVSIPGLLEAEAAPITNPVTGAAHQARVVLPHGFEYTEAEYCSSTLKSGDPIPLEWEGRHGHFYMLHMTQAGPVH